MMIQQKSVILHWTRLALADVLVEELRDEVSEHGLCYIRPVRRLACGDLYQVQVAATEALLHDQPLLVFLTECQLRSTVPLDVRTEGKSLDRLHRMLKAHIATVQPVKETVHASQERQGQTQEVALVATDEVLEVSSEVLQETLARRNEQHIASSQLLQASSDVPLVPLDDEVVELTPDELQAIIEPLTKEVLTIGNLQVRPHIGFSSYRVQQAFLQLAVNRLMGRLYGCQQRAQALVLEASCKLMTQLQRWQRSTRQQVVNVVNEQQQAMWRLVIGAPVPLALSSQPVPLFPYGRVSQ